MIHKNFLALFTTIILLLTILTSCGISKISYTAEISAPEKNEVPLFGTWTIEKYVKLDNFSDSDEEIGNLLGKKLVFSNDMAEINENAYYNLDYKIKTVSTEDYFLNNFKLSPSSLNIYNDSISVITLSSDNNFLSNYVLLAEGSIVTSMNGIFYYLTKVDSYDEIENSTAILQDEEIAVEEDTEKIVETGSANKIEDTENKDDAYSKIVNSGILLCLKSYVDKDYDIPYSLYDRAFEPSYRTLWISFNGKHLSKVAELPHILFPRKSGFWKIDTDRVVENKYIKDYLYAYPLQSSIDKVENDESIPENTEFNDLIDINFIGTDYLSLNLNGAGFYEGAAHSYSYQLMRVVPIDTIYGTNETPIPITKILGETGEQSLKEGAVAFLNSVDDQTKKSLESNPESLSFGVTRDTGKWTLLGRLNYADESSRGNFADFTIPAIPPKELVAHDNLYPSWSNIKENVPDAVDAFSSPLENFIIVLTQKHILAYSVENGMMAPTPLTEISLIEGEIPIMAQWATGNYVNSWNETVTTEEK